MLLVTLALLVVAIIVVLIATYPFNHSPSLESVDQLRPNGLLGR